MNKALIITSLLVGIFLSLQVRSFRQVEFLVQRSEPENFLVTLQTFQRANAGLKNRIAEVQKTLSEIDTRLAAASIEKDIRQMQLLSGNGAVVGEGIELKLNIPIKSFWITDLIAQLVSSGAEAFAVNNVRLTSGTAGFREIQGGILMCSVFLRPPYTFSVIGPKDELLQAINQSGGIIDRMKKATPGLNVEIYEKDQIVIPAVSLY